MNPRSYMVVALLLFLTACASSQGLHPVPHQERSKQSASM